MRRRNFLKALFLSPLGLFLRKEPNHYVPMPVSGLKRRANTFTTGSESTIVWHIDCIKKGEFLSQEKLIEGV